MLLEYIIGGERLGLDPNPNPNPDPNPDPALALALALAIAVALTLARGLGVTDPQPAVTDPIRSLPPAPIRSLALTRRALHPLAEGGQVQVGSPSP